MGILADDSMILPFASSAIQQKSLMWSSAGQPKYSTQCEKTSLAWFIFRSRNSSYERTGISESRTGWLFLIYIGVVMAIDYQGKVLIAALISSTSPCGGVRPRYT